ncbi:hypothetical protein PPTG_07248 [Phytophthora nicotianae INRA-310]|uniref:Uncharacterized protein n=1 Tax=Phytophthora nicotianae (strain INRA-310) TaxID=761204 RepID=W2QPZ9_PHYN3|nr:hypothetical protein PPTG_07248 [Phytophthora nicotianae INRA-310]ETN15031.1 hypothetical protein PPTG_07248 [Phytophthora nicotianae INRA-310]
MPESFYFSSGSTEDSEETKISLSRSSLLILLELVAYIVAKKPHRAVPTHSALKRYSTHVTRRERPEDANGILTLQHDARWEAPIFQMADYGLVDDLFNAVPELTEKI